MSPMRHIPFRMAMNDRISGTRRHSKADGLLKDHDERGGNPSALQHSLARCVHAWGTNFALRPHYTTPGALYTFSLVSHMVLGDEFFLTAFLLLLSLLMIVCWQPHPWCSVSEIYTSRFEPHNLPLVISCYSRENHGQPTAFCF